MCPGYFCRRTEAAWANTLKLEASKQNQKIKWVFHLPECTPLRFTSSTESTKFADDLTGKDGKPITWNVRLTISQTSGPHGAAARKGYALARRQKRRQFAGCAEGSTQSGQLSHRSFYLHFRPQQNVWCYPWNHIWTEPC